MHATVKIANLLVVEAIYC